MGWSGKGITDGDEPMDYISDIESLCGFDFENDDIVKVLTKEKLEEIQPIIFEKWKKADVTIYAFQVLGAILVQGGAQFDTVVYNTCLDSLKKDEWAKTDLERKYHIDFLINILENYDEIPTKYWDDRLTYDVMFKDKGKSYIEYVNVVIEILKKQLPSFVVKIFTCRIGIAAVGICVILDTADDRVTEWMKSNASSSYFDIKIVYIDKEDIK